MQSEEGGRRSSRDKEINDEGEKLLEKVIENRLHIMNGKTAGDEEGEFTYIGYRASTVLDYVITNDRGENIIQRMKVERRVESDHAAIELDLGLEVVERENKEREVICWNDDTIRAYRVKIAESKEREWKDVKRKIQRSIPRRKMKEKRGDNRWWDKECKEARRKLQKALREMEEIENERDKYRKEKNEYKELLELKKR